MPPSGSVLLKAITLFKVPAEGSKVKTAATASLVVNKGYKIAAAFFIISGEGVLVSVLFPGA